MVIRVLAMDTSLCEDDVAGWAEFGD